MRRCQQDTNPIQEKIYFALLGKGHDFTVVGDDDQSLYRFRGATVEALVDFDERCKGRSLPVPTTVYLHENRRSHPQIVEWVNRYIGTHPEMKDPLVRVRAPGKPALVAKSGLPDSYPGVMVFCEPSPKDNAQKLVQCIRELKDGGFITDWSQIALLTYSARESKTIRGAIGDYIAPLREADIPVFNPRSGTAQKDEQFQALLAAVAWILDPDFAYTRLPASLPGSGGTNASAVIKYVQDARARLQTLFDSGHYKPLEDYICASNDAIESTVLRTDGKDSYARHSGGARATLGGIFFKLLALEPFRTMFRDEEGAAHVKALNKILAQYEALYDSGQIKVEDDPLNFGKARVEGWTLYNFYAVFVEGFHDKLNQTEDDETSVQRGMVNAMTIHQSKGLEFEVVFLLRPDKMPFESDTHIIEDQLLPFVAELKGVARRNASMRAAEDAIRLFFVGHSRAKRLLVLVGNNPSEWARSVGYSSSVPPTALTTPQHLAAQGVLVL